MDLSRLICCCQQGDPDAIRVLIDSYKAPLYRLSLSILRDPTEADEATQDAFVAAISKLDTYRRDSSFKTWLYAIALNVCRGRLRKWRVRKRLYQALKSALRMAPNPTIHPEQIALHNEMDRTVWQAINQLGMQQREVVVLRYYHELTLNEVAQVVGVSERTVRTQLLQAHERLRVWLEGEID